MSAGYQDPGQETELGVLEVAPEDGDPHRNVPSFGRLTGAEFRRLGYRRLVRVVALVVVLGFLVAVVLIYLRHDRPSAADLAAATRARDNQLAMFQQGYQDCLKQQPAGSDEPMCGPPPPAEDFPISEFLKRKPLQPGQVSDYALAIGVAVAMLGFLVGASFIGAEWSSRNLVSWLYWEPRRLRLMAAKLLALLSVLLATAVLAQLVWLGVAHLLLHYRGQPVSSLGPQARHFWRHVIDGQLRVVLLVLPTSLLGFSLANLMRHTAAAFGTGFVYFAVVESVVRSWNPDWQPYLLTTNIGAWISNGGLTVFGRQVFDPRVQGITARPIHLSNLHGATVLAVYSALLLLVSLAVFHRRDVS
jgi:ABC-2 type transport system permease protein